jgi:hypothetical protein
VSGDALRRLTRSAGLLAPILASAASLALALPTGAGASERASEASTYATGIGNERAQMFTNGYWTRLHTKIVRYVAPYDAAVHRDSLNSATAFIRAAEAARQQVLVAFYHSEHTPTRLPGVGEYRYDVRRFVERFPHVRQYQAWNEANRGNVPRAFSSPSAALDARYYQALIRSCPGCAVIGLDVLDAANIRPTLNYIAAFKHAIGQLQTVMPSVWGLHNYADLNDRGGWRTPLLARALGGQVWLTETGGIVKFAHAFTNLHGAGLLRAAAVLERMFKLAAAVPQIRRLYIYDWTGGTSTSRFDAGLTNAHEQPRAGYNVVCRRLHASSCATRLSKT